MHYCKILPKDLLESQGRNFFHKPVGDGALQVRRVDPQPAPGDPGRPARAERRLLRRPQALPLGHRVQPPLHRRPVRGGQRAPGHGDVGAACCASAILVLESDTLRTHLPGPELRYPSLDRAGGPQGPGPRARQGRAWPGPSIRPRTVHLPLENFIPPLLPGFFPRAGRTGRRSRRGQAPPRPSPRRRAVREARPRARLRDAADRRPRRGSPASSNASSRRWGSASASSTCGSPRTSSGSARPT
ncbi:MAG: hypothetical protein MZV64_63795 [Ignavibacteriales bacterium]|nr:hypothetical protein [Ignavibacteriales bacterium]